MREKGESARRGNMRNARNRNEGRENAKRKRKTTTERESAEITSVRRNRIKESVTGRTDTIVEGKIRLTVVRAVWRYFTPYLSRLSSSPFSVNSSCIFFPFLSHASSPSFSLYCYVIATVLFWIWQTRNLATFRNSVLNVNQIVNLIKKDVSCRILGAKQDEKENFWSTGSVLCKISDTRSISFFPYCS